MKLFAWQPNGHGQQSFFVMAKDEEQARAAVEAEIPKLLAMDGAFFTDDDCDGWGTEYYRLSVCEEGEVVRNNNY